MSLKIFFIFIFASIIRRINSLFLILIILNTYDI